LFHLTSVDDHRDIVNSNRSLGNIGGHHDFSQA
jgi:hypothetical protein